MTTKNEKRRRAKQLRAKGKSYQEIADALGITRSGAQYLVSGNYDPDREHQKYLRRKQRGYYDKR